MPTLVTRPIRRPPNRQRSILIFLAIIGAVLIHLLVLLAVIWVVPHWPRGRLRAKARPIELTLVPPDAPTPAPGTGPEAGKPTPPPYIRTTDDQAADKPPVDPAFISSQDTNAASMLPANGDKPLPTTEGKNIPSFDFDPRPYRPGTKAADAATSAPSAEATPVAAVATPTPVNKKPPLPAKNRAARKPTTQPTPATGDPAMMKAEPAESPEPPMPTPTETPKDEENSAPTPPPRTGRQAQTATANPSTVTSTGAPKPPGYQPMSIPAKITGNINNRGKSAVAAIGTPLGRYTKAVDDAIGMLWYYQTEQQASDLAPGTVKIHFYIARDGRVRDVRFTGGNSNGALGLISERAITEAQIEPIPPEVAAALDGGQLEDEISFSFYAY